MNSVVKNSIEKGISYQEYRSLVATLVEQNTNSGSEKTKDLANYTALNDRRMKRWDKTVKITDEAKEKIEKLTKKITFLIITESWCGDAAHVIPVLNKIATVTSNIEIKIVFRDDNLELMDMFLTNGGRAIAKVVIIDNEAQEVLNTYGPRPSQATSLVNNYKEIHGKLTPEFKEDLQHWYNKNKGQNIIHDITSLITKLELTN